MMGPPTLKVALYLEGLKKKMVSCTRKAGHGKLHAVTVEGMCKDITEYTNACKRMIQASGLRRRKKAAACETLDLAFLNPADIHTYPAFSVLAAEVSKGTVYEYEADTIRRYFSRGLARLEREFLKYPESQKRYWGLYAARESLYMRQAFRDWGPKTAPNGIWYE